MSDIKGKYFFEGQKNISAKYKLIADMINVDESYPDFNHMLLKKLLANYGSAFTMVLYIDSAIQELSEYFINPATGSTWVFNDLLVAASESGTPYEYQKLGSPLQAAYLEERERALDLLTRLPNASVYGLRKSIINHYKETPFYEWTTGNFWSKAWTVSSPTETFKAPNYEIFLNVGDVYWFNSYADYSEISLIDLPISERIQFNMVFNTGGLGYYPYNYGSTYPFYPMGDFLIKDTNYTLTATKEIGETTVAFALPWDDADADNVYSNTVSNFAQNSYIDFTFL